MKVFIHGGVPGITPYASGPHIWGRVDGLAVSVTGSTVDAMTESVRKAIEGKGKCHLVGHDLGGLLALNLAIEAPQLVNAAVMVVDTPGWLTLAFLAFVFAIIAPSSKPVRPLPPPPPIPR